MGGLGLVALLFSLWRCRGELNPWRAPNKSPDPKDYGPGEDYPYQYGKAPPRRSSPPWPANPPSSLPRFPGSGWTFATPVTAEVSARARALVSPLWAKGAGSYQVERLGRRWIAFRAEIVASGKKGVVAYRPKTASEASPGVARAKGRPRSLPRPASAPRVPTAVPSSPPRRRESPVALPVLRRGRGMPPARPDASVRLAQQRLGVTADGRFGSGTERAVRAFQRSRGLASDGVVGPDTWSALMATARA